MKRNHSAVGGNEFRCREGSSIFRVGDADRRDSVVFDLERKGPRRIGPEVRVLLAAWRNVFGRTEIFDQGVGVGTEINIVEAVALRGSGTGELQRHDFLSPHGGDEIRMSSRTFEKVELRR